MGHIAKCNSFWVAMESQQGWPGDTTAIAVATSQQHQLCNMSKLHHPGDIWWNDVAKGNDWVRVWVAVTSPQLFVSEVSVKLPRLFVKLQQSFPGNGNDDIGAISLLWCRVDVTIMTFDWTLVVIVTPRHRHGDYEVTSRWNVAAATRRQFLVTSGAVVTSPRLWFKSLRPKRDLNFQLGLFLAFSSAEATF